MTATRGRPRSTQIHSAVAKSLRELLMHHDYARISVDQIAAAAGVSKAAIYRRWGSKAEMVFALLIHGPELSPGRFDCGSLAADVAALAAHVQQVLGSAAGRHAIPGLLADLQSDPALAAAFRTTFVSGELSVIEALLDRAGRRHELSRVVDAEDVLAQLLGTTFAWLFLLPTEQALPADLNARISRSVLAAL